MGAMAKEISFDQTLASIPVGSRILFLCQSLEGFSTNLVFLAHMGEDLSELDVCLIQISPPHIRQPRYANSKKNLACGRSTLYVG